MRGIILVGLAAVVSSGCLRQDAPPPVNSSVAEVAFISGPADPDASVELGCPAQVVFQSQRRGKPPLRFYHVQLVLNNRHTKPMWLVMPRWGDGNLEPSAVFDTKAFPDPPTFTESRQWTGDGGKAVQVELLGPKGFHAFQIPTGGTVAFKDYVIETWSVTKEVELWEVSELRVNDKEPLDLWLPYSPLSGKNVTIPETSDWKGCCHVDKYRKDKVESVRATVVKRWRVPIQNAPKGDPN